MSNQSNTEKQKNKEDDARKRTGARNLNMKYEGQMNPQGLGDRLRLLM